MMFPPRRQSIWRSFTLLFLTSFFLTWQSQPAAAQVFLQRVIDFGATNFPQASIAINMTVNGIRLAVVILIAMSGFAAYQANRLGENLLTAVQPAIVTVIIVTIVELLVRLILG